MNSETMLSLLSSLRHPKLQSLFLFLKAVAADVPFPSRFRASPGSLTPLFADGAGHAGADPTPQQLLQEMSPEMSPFPACCRVPARGWGRRKEKGAGGGDSSEEVPGWEPVVDGGAVLQAARVEVVPAQCPSACVRQGMG